VVIQCAATKHPDSGYLISQEGKKVSFVANPAEAPDGESIVHARPDSDSDTRGTWRDVLCEYNKSKSNSNPLNLKQASDLYSHPIYAKLPSVFGKENVYVLSAGWGLIRSDFLTPYYDITFNGRADAYKRRRKNDRYDDFSARDLKTDEIVFFGGKDYLSFFISVTGDLECKKTIFFNSKTAPNVANCSFFRYPTTARTNCHYQCAEWFANEHS